MPTVAQNIGTPGAIATGIGAGAAGAIPTPSSGNYSSNTNTSSNTVNSQQLQQLIQQLIQSQQQTQQTQTTTPVLDPQTQALLASLLSRAGGIQVPSLGGYVGQQTQQINQNTNAQQGAVDAILASRGLSTSPVAGTVDANIQQNRLNQITQLGEQAPLQLNNVQLQNLLAQLQLFGAIPKGVTTTGTGTTTGTTGTTGITGTSGISTSNTYGQQNTSGTQQQQQGGGVGGGLSGVIATLLSLFA